MTGPTEADGPSVSDLWHRGDVEGLIRTLERPEPSIRAEAVGHLSTFHDRRAFEAIVATRDGDANRYVRDKAAATLELMTKQNVEGPIIRLKGGDSLSRWSAAHTLADGYFDPRAAEALIVALKDDDDISVRKAAAAALGEIGGPRAAEALAVALKDDSVRLAAAFALGEMGDPRAAEALIVALKDDDISVSVRKAAAEALGKTGDPRAAEATAAVTATLVRRVRRRAILTFVLSLLAGAASLALVAFLGPTGNERMDAAQWGFSLFAFGFGIFAIVNAFRMLSRALRPVAYVRKHPEYAGGKFEE